MTTNTIAPLAEYVEDGATLTHPIPFKFLDVDDLVVSRIAAGVETVLTLGTDYSATGAGAAAGGELVKTSGGTVGTKLRIRRLTARAQGMDYTPNDTFPAESHEASLDKLMLIAQEQDADIGDVEGRAFLVPPGETGDELPALASRQNRLAAWGASGSLAALAVGAAGFVAVTAAGVPSVAAPPVVTGASGLAVNSRALMAGVASPAADQAAFLTEAGNEGMFVWKSGDYSAEVTDDGYQGIYVPLAADPTPGGQGAFQRVLNGRVSIKWFGAVGDGVTNDAAAIEAARKAAITLGCALVIPKGIYYTADTELVFAGSGLVVIGEPGHEIRGHGGGDGGYVVSFASEGGLAQPASGHPVNQLATGLRVRTVAPFHANAGRAAIRVCSKFSTFLDCSATTNSDPGGNGFRLEADNTGSGPYYNSFIECNGQGVQDGTATGFGVMMRQKAGTTVASRYPNTCLFLGGRMGGYAVNWEMSGGGHRLDGVTSENYPGYGVAFKWSAATSISNVGCIVIAPYIENAAIAYQVSDGAAAPEVHGSGMLTGITTLTDDPSERLTFFGGDGIRGMRLAKAPNPHAPRSGIAVGNADNPDGDTLDWYKEGTWTPTLAGATTPGSYSLTVIDASYTRIGNKVFLTAQMTVTVTSPGTGAVKIGGFPFPKGSGRIINGAVQTSGVTLDAATKFVGVAHTTTSPDSSCLVRQIRSAAAPLNLDCSALATGNVLTLTLAYTA